MLNEKNLQRHIEVPDGVELLQFAEVGFGSNHPDLAIIHIVSNTDGKSRDHWFALSRQFLSELGNRFAMNAHRTEARDLN